MPVTRLLTVDDAAPIAELLARNREFLAPWDPVRGADYFTATAQGQLIESLLVEHDRGTTVPHVILGPDGELAGRITLNGIVRGPFLSCSVGYWVAQAANGRGVATRALADMLELAFGSLGLHRVEAGTLLHNDRSQRVLEKNGFVRYGLAPRYLRIAGRWQDHVLFQRLATDD